jgi:glycosyltransferase involved in cell wall biosynthesis
MQYRQRHRHKDAVPPLEKEMFNHSPQSKTKSMSVAQKLKKLTQLHRSRFLTTLFVICISPLLLTYLSGDNRDAVYFPTSVRSLSFRAELPKKTCVITTSAANKFGVVMTLYDSVMENSPSIDCFIWFMADISEPTAKVSVQGYKEIKNVAQGKDKFSMVTMREMEKSLESFDALKTAFIYNMNELQTAIKPFALQHTLKNMGADAVIYLEHDIWVTDSLEEIQSHLAYRSAVVTPHYMKAVPEDGNRLSDRDIAETGVFNFDFVSFSNTPSAHKFLKWWGDRFIVYGKKKLKNDFNHDQNWGMFIPAFFDHEDYFVIRDLRYNVAYWNLHERGAQLHMKDGYPHLENLKTMKDERVVFTHFTGISIVEKYDMFTISQHQTRYSIADFPRLSEVFDAYHNLLSKHDSLHYHEIPYGYDHFSDGTKITESMREMYIALVYPVPTTGSYQFDKDPPYEISFSPFVRYKFANSVAKDPFCASKKCHSDSSKISYLDWVWETSPEYAVDMQGKFFFSSIEQDIYRKRPDVQLAFPDPLDKNFRQFKKWFAEHGTDEGHFEQDLIEKWKVKWAYHRRNHSRYHKDANQLSRIENVGMNIIGWHAGEFSIGISGVKMIHAAKSVKIPVNAIELKMPLLHKFQRVETLDFELTRSISEPINFVVINAEEFHYALEEIPTRIWKSKYNIAYWAWELDVFKERWMSMLSNVDEVWCPSYFVKNAIESAPTYSGTPIRVLPIPLKTAEEVVQNPDEEKSELLHQIIRDTKKSKSFVFLVAFDFHSFIERKNPIAAIKAFLEAFPAEKDVNKEYTLIVKSHWGTSEDIEKLRELTNFDTRVIFLNELLSDADNRLLYEFQDCLVSLHRSEGYGMIILETLANGIPVIATDYSGNVDFFHSLSAFNGICTFPIPYKLIEIQESYGPYTKGNRWADADLSSAAEAMRTVVSTNCKNKSGKAMKKMVQRKYGPKAIGKQMKTMMNEIIPKAIKRTQ